MDYQGLIQAYFERSTALQWDWTVYVLVIGGVLGFSTFRQRPELVTSILFPWWFFFFAYKNLGALEATAEEREAIRLAAQEFPDSGSNGVDVKRVRDKLEPKMPE